MKRFHRRKIPERIHYHPQPKFHCDSRLALIKHWKARWGAEPVEKKNPFVFPMAFFRCPEAHGSLRHENLTPKAVGTWGQADRTMVTRGKRQTGRITNWEMASSVTGQREEPAVSACQAPDNPIHTNSIGMVSVHHKHRYRAWLSIKKQ